MYATSIHNQSDLDNAYHVTEYDSNEEAIYAANAYYNELIKQQQLLLHKEAALEIGCGNGAIFRQVKRFWF